MFNQGRKGKEGCVRANRRRIVSANRASSYRDRRKCVARARAISVITISILHHGNDYERVHRVARNDFFTHSTILLDGRTLIARPVIAGRYRARALAPMIFG